MVLPGLPMNRMEFGTAGKELVSRCISKRLVHCFASQHVSECSTCEKRIMVLLVLPPSISLIMSMCPVIARPTLQVSPTTSPLRFLMAEMRCKVPGTPARLSPPNSPTVCSAASKSLRCICMPFLYSWPTTERKIPQPEYSWSVQYPTSCLLSSHLLRQGSLQILPFLEGLSRRQCKSSIKGPNQALRRCSTSILRKISPPRWPRNLASGHLPRSKMTCPREDS